MTDATIKALVEASVAAAVKPLVARLDAAGIPDAPAAIVAYAPFTVFAESPEPITWDNDTKGWNTAYHARVAGSYTFNGKRYDVRDTNRAIIRIKSGETIPATVPANTEIWLASGGQYRVTRTIVLSANSGIRTDGGVRATITTPAGSGWAIESRGEDTFVINLAFDSDHKGPEKKCWDAIRPNSKRITIANCLWLNVNYAINCEFSPDGVFDLDNASAGPTSVKAYHCWSQGSNIVSHRPKCHNSTVEHCYRTAGVRNVQIVDPDFTELSAAQSGAAGDILKGALTLQKCERVYIDGGTLRGPVGTGPLAVDAKPSADLKAQRSRDVIFDGVRIDGRLNIRHGSDRVTFVDCTGCNDGQAFFLVDGYNATFERGVTNLTIEGCKITSALTWKDAASGQYVSELYPAADRAGANVNGFLIVAGAVVAGLAVDGLTIRENKFVSPFFRAANAKGGGSWVLRADGPIANLTIEGNDFGAAAAYAVGGTLMPFAEWAKAIGATTR